MLAGDDLSALTLAGGQPEAQSTLTMAAIPDVGSSNMLKSDYNEHAGLKNNPTTASATQVPPSLFGESAPTKPRDKMPFFLLEVLPKPGMTYRKFPHVSGNKTIDKLLAPQDADERIMWALWDDMPDVPEGLGKHQRMKFIKNQLEEQLLAPLFALATKMVRNNEVPSAFNDAGPTVLGDDQHRTPETWRQLFRHLQLLSPKLWVTKLHAGLFWQFFASLVLAREHKLASLRPGEHTANGADISQLVLVSAIDEFTCAIIEAGYYLGWLEEMFADTV